MGHDTDCQTPGFFRDGGTHFSEIGLAIYLDVTRDALNNMFMKSEDEIRI